MTFLGFGATKILSDASNHAVGMGMVEINLNKLGSKTTLRNITISKVDIALLLPNTKDLLSKIEILRTTPFRPLQALSKSLNTWLNPIARMFRYDRSNGVVEGFHRKMKLIQRRAYGFRNFENYRMRVKVLCG